MKNFTKKATFLPILIFAIFMSAIYIADAQSIQLTGQETKLSITLNTYNHLNLENSLSKIRAFKVKSVEGDFSQLKIDGYGYSMEIGKPKLPVIKKLIEVPLGANIEITITDKSFKDYDLADFGINDPIIPAQLSVSKSCEDPSQLPFEIDQITYATDALIGNRLVKVVDLGMMRGVMIARLEIAPIHYNPVKNIIRVYEDIDVEISFSGADVAGTIEMKEEQSNRYFRSVHQMLFNYKPLPIRDLIEDSPVTYIIVSDPMFEDALQPFIEWKTKKGFNVVEAYTNDPNVGTTTSSIKNFLKDFYEDPPEGFNPQSFVLFVGDIDQIPAFSGNAGGHVTDLYYCEYTNDWFPEAYYGRFSANNLGELQPQIDKTLEYEQYLFPDPSFLDYVVMVAGADGSHQMTWGNGQINYGTEYYFNEEHGIYSYTYLQPEPGGGNYSQNIHQNISDGVSFANYTAHCSPAGWADPSFVISDIPGLTNANKYPLMIGNCCSSVEFQIDCFGEEILRAPNKGALGYVGGSNSTYWDEDYWWGVGFESVSANPVYNPDHLGAYDRTFHDREGLTIDDWYVAQGQVPSAGNLAVTQAGGAEEYYWEIYHLMGDPSLMIYYSQPPDINASFAALMPLGSLTFTVNTDPYSYVAISKDGVLHGTALADADGLAEVVFETPVSVPGEADIVITGQNLKPYFGTVLVASPNGAYVLLDGFEVNDDAGNGNGMADYGENFSLNVSMKNLGSEAGENVTLSLTSDDDYITINNGTADLGNIAPNEVINLNDVFGLTVAENIPDQHSMSFTLEATDGTDTWTSNFSITGNAPVLEFSDFMISDPTGNNNGKIDPGETVDILVYIENTGSADAYNALCELTTGSMYLTVVTTGPQEIGDIGPTGSGTATFEVTASAATPPGQVAVLNVDIAADMGVNADGGFTLVIGQIPVLIVDLDENNNSANVMIDAIDEFGIATELTTSFPADLNLYSSIFVCLGVYSDNYALSDAEGQALADYLNNGGMLYMEGGDTWYYDDQTAVHAMFGINGIEDGSGDLSTIDGVAGTMTDGMSYNYTGDNSWIDHLEAVGVAEVIFNNQSPAYSCAVSNELGGYKTIGASFEFGGLTDTGSQIELMEKYLEFFEVLNSMTMNCNITASPDEICQGETSQLNVEVYGGSGNYEYLWAPETGLSDPTISNPIATPEETTTYTVTITDQISSEQIVDQMMLFVDETPETPTITQTGNNLVSSSATGNQWYDDDGMVPGATDQILLPGEAGNYWTIVTNMEGCASAPSNVIYFQPTNIVEIENGGTFNVYPNPAGDMVTVEYFTGNNQEISIGLYNAYGQKLHQITQTSYNRTGAYLLQFDVSDVMAGLYYFKIEGPEFSLTQKIIISK